MNLQTYKWIFQRLSTPIIVFLFFWLVYNIYFIHEYNYEIINIFFDNYINLFLFILFLILSLTHTAIEVFHAISDYFAETKNEKIILIIVNILYMIIILSILIFIITHIF